MKTSTLFLLRILLPPFYAATVLALVIALFEPNPRATDFAASLGVCTLYAYLFAGLPALLFAILMGRFARRRPAIGGRLLRAALFGLVSGALITAMLGFDSPWLFLPLGAAVGLLVESTIIPRERRSLAPITTPLKTTPPKTTTFTRASN